MQPQIGAAIRELRKERNVTQEALAEHLAPVQACLLQPVQPSILLLQFHLPVILYCNRKHMSVILSQFTFIFYIRNFHSLFAEGFSGFIFPP